jgi:hypothetical protein
MKRNQPWQDTYCLLAGTEVRRSSRPGERFGAPTPAVAGNISYALIHRIQSLITLFVSAVILALRA